jgi:hypothetical protein
MMQVVVVVVVDEGSSSTYFAVPLGVYEQIFRFQIAINEIQIMQVFEAQNNLGCIEPGMMFTARMEQNVRHQCNVQSRLTNWGVNMAAL